MALSYFGNCHTSKNIASITGHDVYTVRARLKNVSPAYYVDKTPMYKLLDWQLYILPKEYDEYLTVQQIAAKYGIAITTTRKVLRGATPTPLTWRKARMFLYPIALVEERFRDAGAGLLSIPEAAARVGMDVRTLHRMMLRHWRDAPLKANVSHRIGKKCAGLYKEEALLKFIQDFCTEYHTKIENFCQTYHVTLLEYQRLCTKLKLNWRRQISEENWGKLVQYMIEKREKYGEKQ